MTSLTQRPAWKSLKKHYQLVKDLHLRNLFGDDPARGQGMTAEAEGIYLDYSKNLITGETLRLLRELAESVNLRDRIQAMFRGDKINITEQRAVLHTALRAPRNTSIFVASSRISPLARPCIQPRGCCHAPAGNRCRSHESGISGRAVSSQSLPPRPPG